MTRRSLLSLFVIPVCLFSLVSLATAQTAKPKRLKAEQLLPEAEAQNGLGEKAASPWHVRAKFETFDDQGKHKSGGTFEEWWMGPQSYKGVFTSDGLNQTDVATSAGLFRSGDQRWTTLQESLVPTLLIDPLSIHPYDPRKIDLQDSIRGTGANQLRCLSMVPKAMPGHEVGSNIATNIDTVPSLCFEPDSTVLRYASGGAGAGVLLLNNMVLFAGRTVSRDVHIKQSGQDYLTVQVQDLGPLPAGSTIPAPPEGSTGPLQGPIELPEGRMRVVGGEEDFQDATGSVVMKPESPDIVLKVSISKAGRVTDVAVVSGTPELARVFAKALRKETFAPFTIAGTPVDVTTTWKKAAGIGPNGAPQATRRGR
jgi:hypothetical protein